MVILDYDTRILGTNTSWNVSLFTFKLIKYNLDCCNWKSLWWICTGAVRFLVEHIIYDFSLFQHVIDSVLNFYHAILKFDFSAFHCNKVPIISLVTLSWSNLYPKLSKILLFHVKLETFLIHNFYFEQFWSMNDNWGPQMPRV